MTDRDPGNAMIPMTALIADDCALTREVHAELLRLMGYHVQMVASGNAAVQAVLHGFETRGLVYDLGLLDFDMPNGNGLVAARAIRAVDTGGKRPPLICATSHDLASVEAECLDAGFDAVLSKPVRPRMITCWLDRLPPGLRHGGDRP